MKNILQQLQYTFHVLLTLKSKTLIIILLQFFIILVLNNLIDYTYCMTNESDNGSVDVGEIKSPDVIETLQDQISHLSSENIQLRREINLDHSQIYEQSKEIAKLKQENQELKDEIVRLEVIIREHYVPKCNIL